MGRVPFPKPSRVEGFVLAVSLLDGPVHTTLTHCLRRFLYEIDNSVTQTDLVGYRADRAIAAPFESNYLSGTAFTVRPNRYPLDVANGFLGREVLIIRDILADCEGTVRWGGDLDPVKESHFQIDVGPSDARLTAVAAKIDRWRQWPGQGAGAAVDVLDPNRR
jgi:hypothetical protein